MNKLSLASILLLSGLLITPFFGCGSVNHVQGSGVVGTDDRTLEFFDSIDITGIGEINIHARSDDSCQVRGDDNLLDKYETRVENNTLFLAASEPISPKSKLMITIKTSNTINKVTARGACKVNLKGIRGTDFELVAEGAADLTCDGEVTKLVFNADGVVQADLSKFECENATVEAVGSANLRLNATKTLDVKASGSSVIHSLGNASVNKTLEGTSRVVE